MMGWLRQPPSPLPSGPRLALVPVPVLGSGLAGDRSRLHLVRGRVTGLVALLGLAVLGLGGGAVRAAAVVTLALGIGVHLLRRARGRPLPASSLRILTAIVAALLLLAPLLTALPWLTSAAFLLCYLQLDQAAVSRGPVEDRRRLLVSFLMALLGCIFTVSPWLAPLFALMAMLAPAALLLCHLSDPDPARPVQVAPVIHRRAVGSALVLGLAALGMTTALYLVIPRLQGGFLAAMGKESIAGFSGEVTLGDIGAIKANPTLAMRVRITNASGDPLTGPFYLRGTALDTFDGHHWSIQAGGRVVTSHLPSFLAATPPDEDALLQEVQLEPLAERVLFGVPEIQELTVDAGNVWRDGNGGYHWAGEPRRLTYTVRSLAPRRNDPRLPKARPDPALSAPTAQARIAANRGLYTSLPTDLDPRIPDLARRITDGAASPWEKALAVESWLQEELTYTALPEDPGRRDPLAVFLFESRRGHCEYFATALAVLLRTQGIPTRLVNGFYGGELNRLGDYLVIRHSDAHSWVEVHLGEAGWIPFDATPTGSLVLREPGLLAQLGDSIARAWYGLILDYDLSTQLGALATSGMHLRGGLGLPPPPESAANPYRAASTNMFLPLALLLGLTGLAWGAWRLLAPRLAGEQASRPPTGGVVETCHRRARDRVTRAGWRVPTSLPPRAAARWLVSRAGEEVAPLQDLAELLYRVRYGGEHDATLAQAARDALRTLRVPPRRTA